MRYHQSNSSQVGTLVFGERRKLVKDHARLNKLAIKHMSRRKEAPVPETKPSKPYPHVASRVMNIAPSGDREYLRRGSRHDAPTPADIHFSRVGRKEEASATPRKAPVPRDRPQLKPREVTNFIDKNRHFKPRTPVEEPETPPRALGQVPLYLSQRKEQLKAEAQQKETGLVKMDELERQTMLANLKQQADTIKSDLDKMPLVISTLKLKQKKLDLEARLFDLDKSIAVFEKPVVYVRD